MDDSSVIGDVGSAASIGINAASGNWIGAAIGAIGLGTSLFGSLSSAGVSKQSAQLSAQNASLEGNENAVRQQAMLTNARRSQLEIVRNAQRARAMSVQTSTTQGAQYGSGAAGGAAETTNEGYFGLQGVNQQVAFGQQMFGLDATISQNKVRMAQLGGTAATDQGIASIGGALMKSGPALGNIFGGIGSKPPGIGNFSNGGNDGAAPTWGG